MSARDAALLWIDNRALPQWPANSIKRALREPDLDPRDRALADNITAGVIKNLLLLQYHIQHYSGRHLNSIDTATQKVLAIGLYQMRFLSRVPVSAAVDEAVNQSRRIGREKASGFVNAVLRNAARSPDADLPDERRDPIAFMTTVLSHPQDVVERLITSFGIEEALRICRHDQCEPPIIVRLLPLASVDQLAVDGVTIVPHERSNLFVVDGATRAILARWAADGVAQAQDATSASTVGALDVRPGQLVLDRCAGRGTKTIQLQSLVGPSGRVIAIDPAEPRIRDLQATLSARNIANVEVHSSSTLEEAGLDGRRFDRVLVDAPCSNSGVFARRHEARYRQSRSMLRSIAHLQRKILYDTAPATKAGGLLAYSTCSIWPDENQRVAEKFVTLHPQYQLIHERVVLPAADSPSAYHDGGYVAVFRRSEE